MLAKVYGGRLTIENASGTNLQVSFPVQGTPPAANGELTPLITRHVTSRLSCQIMVAGSRTPRRQRVYASNFDPCLNSVGNPPADLSVFANHGNLALVCWPITPVLNHAGKIGATFVALEPFYHLGVLDLSRMVEKP